MTEEIGRGPDKRRMVIWAVVVVGYLVLGLFPGPQGWDALALGGTIPATGFYWIVYTLLGSALMWLALFRYDPYPPPEADLILLNAANAGPVGKQDSGGS